MRTMTPQLLWQHLLEMSKMSPMKLIFNYPSNHHQMVENLQTCVMYIIYMTFH